MERPLSQLPPPAPASRPAAGWYPDPWGSGGLRWWDGQRWTGHQHLRDGTTRWSDDLTTGLASFGQRLGAAVIDWLVLLPLTALTFVPFVGLFISRFDGWVREIERAERFGARPDLEMFWTLWVAMLAVQLVLMVLTAAYFVLFESGRYGQTIGKWAMGIAVRDPGRQETISSGRAVARFLVKAFASGILFLGYLWMLWDDQRRTWHDLAADSRVVRVHERPTLAVLVRDSLRRR